MICPFCHAENRDDNTACTRCGAALGQKTANPGKEAAPDWELNGNLFNVPSFFITVREVLFAPGQTFNRLKPGNAIFNAFLFGLIGGSIGGIVSTFWSSLVSLFGLLPQNNEIAHMLGNAQNIVIAMFFTPIFTALGLFAVSGLLHVCLMITGRSSLSFATTFKVFCYAHGSTALLNIVPLFGGLAAFFWSLFINIIGLREAHRISSGQAAVAVLLPFILCCGCAAFAGIGLFVSGFSFLHLINNM
jgi:hypothetical protein